MVGRYPITLLDPDTQMRVYQHFENPLDAKRLFANLTDALTHDDRLDEHDQDRGHLTVLALRAWEAADFPGTWDEWWTSYYSRHVQEHQEWLAWSSSDSHMSFSDWQEQKACEGEPPVNSSEVHRDASASSR